MRPPRTRDLLLLSFLYFPLNLFWTAMNSQLLAVRVEALAGTAYRGQVIGLIECGGAIMATLVTLLIGPLSDNTTHSLGRRYPWVFGGVLLGAVASIQFAFATTIFQLLAAFVLVRIGLHAAVAAYEALVPDRVPLERQGQASGFAEMWDVLGMVCGLLLTFLLTHGVVSKLLHLRPPMGPAEEIRLAVSIICALSAGLFFLCLWMNMHWIIGEPLGKAEAHPWRKVLLSSLKWDPREAPDFTRLFVSRCVLSAGIYTGFTYIRYYVQDSLDLKGGDVSYEVMIISLIFSVGGMIGSLLGAILADRVSKRALLYFFCSMAIVASIGFCLTTSVSVARVMAFAFGIPYSAISAVDWAFATNLVPRGREGRYLAIFQCSHTVPQIFVGLVGGIVGQHYGFRNLYWCIPVFLLAGMLLLNGIRERGEIPEFDGETLATI